MATYPIHFIDADEALEMVCQKVCRYCAEDMPACRREGDPSWMHKVGDAFMACGATQIQDLRFTIGENNSKVVPDEANVETISLMPACYWDCCKCGQVNYLATQHREITGDQLTDILREKGELEPYESAPENAQAVGHIVPKYVRCFRCGDWFRTSNFMKARNGDG